jgi:hypothetical protein
MMKNKSRYGTISKLFEAAKVLSKKGKRQYRKEDTSFELDTFITAMCIEERDGMLYLFYRQQIILKTMLT